MMMNLTFLRFRTIKLLRVGIFVLILLFSLIFVESAEIKEVSIKDYINDDLSIEENIEIDLVDNSEDSFNFTLPRDSYNISINNNPAQIQSNFLSIPLSCSTCKIEVSYNLPQVVKRESAKSYAFSRTLNLPISPNFLIYSVSIPEERWCNPP